MSVGITNLFRASVCGDNGKDSRDRWGLHCVYYLCMIGTNCVWLWSESIRLLMFITTCNLALYGRWWWKTNGHFTSKHKAQQEVFVATFWIEKTNCHFFTSGSPDVEKTVDSFSFLLLFSCLFTCRYGGPLEVLHHYSSSASILL